MSDLGTLTGSAMASAGSKKKLKKVGQVYMDEGGQYYTTEDGSGTAYKTQAEAERAMGSGGAQTASAMKTAPEPSAPGSAMDAKGTQDGGLAAVAHLMENQKWSDAWLEINKLDPKKYANDKSYIQMKRLIKQKAGL